MASAESRVWVGFIEDLPVVGSVKEAVDWVLAVAADDLDLAEEKLQVITGRCGKLTLGRLIENRLKEKRTRSSSGYSTASTACSTPRRMSASLIAMEVESISEMNLMAHIIEVANKQTKGKQPAESQAARQKKVQKIREETLQKIHRINQNYAFPRNEPPLDDHGRRSRRGEHVINNDVATIYSKVVDDFMRQNRLNNTLNIACPLDDETVQAIMYELVTHFDEDELYINANALIYGEYSRVLKAALKEFLTMPVHDRMYDVSDIVRIMNAEEAYVDGFAKIKWIGNQRGKRERFEEIRNKVATMFTNWANYFNIVKVRFEELGLARY